MAELEGRRLANMAKQEISETESKVQYQALMLGYLLQRRFEHVVMATRIYRVLFGDGDTMLKTNKDSQLEKMFTQGLGFNPTLGNFDAMANEAIRDVDESVQAFVYLVDRGDLDSASKRLSEAFMIGEYLAKMRTLPRAKKEKVLDFVRDSNQLLSAIEVKDYALAESLVAKVEGHGEGLRRLEGDRRDRNRPHRGGDAHQPSPRRGNPERPSQGRRRVKGGDRTLAEQPGVEIRLLDDFPPRRRAGPGAERSRFPHRAEEPPADLE